MSLDPKIWGPHYWFVLHTIALGYPLNPNETSKKKYYDFIQNLPIFIPVANIGNLFSKILDDYPVTPYLDSRESLIKWFHYIHNKINEGLGIPEKTMAESLQEYYKHYELKEVSLKNNILKREKYIYFALIIILAMISVSMYKK